MQKSDGCKGVSVQCAPSLRGPGECKRRPWKDGKGKPKDELRRCGDDRWPRSPERVRDRRSVGILHRKAKPGAQGMGGIPRGGG